MTNGKILLVEDNEGDILLTMEAFRQADITNGIHVVRDGEEAICYLRKENQYSGAETPDLVFLDINLPRIDGKEVLQHIKKDEKLMQIPVVMLTTSDSRDDINECYEKGVNCFITKPADLRVFFQVIKVVKEFWLTVAKLPNKQNYG